MTWHGRYLSRCASPVLSPSPASCTSGSQWRSASASRLGGKTIEVACIAITTSVGRALGDRCPGRQGHVVGTVILTARTLDRETGTTEIAGRPDSRPWPDGPQRRETPSVRAELLRRLIAVD